MSDMDVDDDFIDDESVSFDEPDFDSEDGNELGLSASIEIRRPPSFESLDEALLLTNTTSLVQEVSDILTLPKPVALILLRHFKYVPYER
jgi:hypothetical protein